MVSAVETAVKTILLVDDEATLIEALQYSLIKEGYRVITAADVWKPSTRRAKGHRTWLSWT